MTAADRDLDVADALVGPDYEPAGPCRITLRDGAIVAVAPPAAACLRGRCALALTGAACERPRSTPRPLSTTILRRPPASRSETWLTRLAAMPAVDPGLAAPRLSGRAGAGCVRPPWST